MFLNIDNHFSGALAVIDCEGSRLTYSELAAEMLSMQERLPERCLAFCLCRNTVGALLGYLAMVDAGVVPVMLSADMENRLLDSLISAYTPRLIWAPLGLASRYGGLVLYEAFGFALVDTCRAVYPLNDLLELCMSTSGSTGSPKLVRYKKGNLEANAKNVARAFGWTSEERALADLGLQYTMGLNVVNTHLYVGATVLLTTHNLLSGEYWDFLESERASNLTGVPFTYEAFARLHFMEKELPYLRTIAEGGGKLSDSRFIELSTWAASTGRRFFATFGTTETAARLSYLPPELAVEKTGSIGRAIPGGSMFLINVDGEEITDAEAEGELCYSGPNVTMGYATCREELALGDEWLGTYRTGDLARRDADGCYYVTGRLSRFLKLLGHRVSLDECERLVAEWLNVACACVGDDEQMIVYVEGDVDISGVSNLLQKLTGLRNTLFKVEQIEVLPRNEAGKVLYARLKEAR